MSNHLKRVCNAMKEIQDAQTSEDLIKVLNSLSKMGSDAAALGAAAPIVDHKTSVMARVVMQDPSILLVKGVDPEHDYLAQEVYFEQSSEFSDEGWYCGKTIDLDEVADAYVMYTCLADPGNSVLNFSSGKYGSVDDFLKEVYSYSRPVVEYMAADDVCALIQNCLLFNGMTISDFGDTTERHLGEMVVTDSDGVSYEFGVE